MPLDDLEKALHRVENTFNQTAVRLESLAQSLMSPPSLCLSRLLLSSIALGRKSPGDKAVCSGRALEFLDQALALGASASSESGYEEEKLLVTDYLYGQAIDQVIETGEARIIDILAGAIIGFAEDRVRATDIAYRSRLIVAALEIALLLGEYDGATATAIVAARSAAARGLPAWSAALPAGRIREYVQQSMSVVTNT